MLFRLQKTVIIVPCYNEENRLELSRFTDFAGQHGEVSFLFVDDGSSDNTLALLQSVRHPQISVLALAVNGGKAEAVRFGMRHALQSDADWIGFWDADLATSLEELLTFAPKIRPGMLMITGCRLVRLGADIKRNFVRHLVSRLFATVISWHLKLPVYDSQCGAKLLQKEAVEVISRRAFVSRWFFDVEILKRLTGHYGRDRICRDVEESTLRSWQEIGDSKVRYTRCIIDLFKVLRDKN